jgi:hypothetical protein
MQNALYSCECRSDNIPAIVAKCESSHPHRGASTVNNHSLGLAVRNACDRNYTAGAATSRRLAHSTTTDRGPARYL